MRVLIFFSLIFFLPIIFGTNLIENNGFESGETNWTNITSAGNPVFSISTFSNSGINSSKISGDSADDTGYWESDYITVENNTRYRFSVSIYANETTDATPRVYFYQYESYQSHENLSKYWTGNIIRSLMLYIDKLNNNMRLLDWNENDYIGSYNNGSTLFTYISTNKTRPIFYFDTRDDTINRSYPFINMWLRYSLPSEINISGLPNNLDIWDRTNSRYIEIESDGFFSLSENANLLIYNSCYPSLTDDWLISKDCTVQNESLSTTKDFLINNTFTYLMENTTLNVGKISIESGGKIAIDLNSKVII